MEEVKPSLFTCDVISCIEKSKESTKKTVRSNKWIQQKKIQRLKSVAFLYANNEQTEKKITKIT